MHAALTATAYHESGHVVVGLEHGRRVLEVVVGAEDGYTEFAPVYFRHPLSGPWEGTPRLVWRCLVEAVAGPAAEVLHTGEQSGGVSLRVGPRLARLGLASVDRIRLGDYRSAADCARHLVRWQSGHAADDAVLAVIAEAEERAEALLRRRWTDVSRLAEALCRAGGRMTGPQVLAALRK